MNDDDQEKLLLGRLVRQLSVMNTVGFVIVCGLLLYLAGRLQIAPGDVAGKVDSLAQLVKAEDVGAWKLSVFEHSSDAWVAVDIHGVVTMWSDGAEQFFGIKRDDVIGYGLGVVIPENMRARHLDGLRKAMSSREERHSSVSCSCQVRGEQRTILVETWTHPGRTAIARITSEGSS